MRILLVLLCLATALAAEESTVRVLSVHDADTIVVLHNGRTEIIRLKGIECPETGEPNSSRAKKYATETIQSKNVLLKTYGKDKYGRTIADLFLENGNLFNQQLVRSGNCRWGRSRAMRN
jgi:endonuclease YncB( thermonuclease family)